MYGQYNERRIEYEEVLLSERTDSQYSQSESYLSERYVLGTSLTSFIPNCVITLFFVSMVMSSSYDYGLSSSQSIDLTFHSFQTAPSHNRWECEGVMLVWHINPPTLQAHSGYNDDHSSPHTTS